MYVSIPEELRAEDPKLPQIKRKILQISRFKSVKKNQLPVEIKIKVNNAQDIVEKYAAEVLVGNNEIFIKIFKN